MNKELDNYSNVMNKELNNYSLTRTSLRNLPGHGFFDILLLLLGEIVALFADLERKVSIGGTNYVKDVPENKSRFAGSGRESSYFFRSPRLSVHSSFSSSRSCLSLFLGQGLK